MEIMSYSSASQGMLIMTMLLIWSSESAGVATVSDRGVITGVSNGTTIFSAERDSLTAVTASRVGQAGFPNTETELNTAIAEYSGLDVYPDAVTLTLDVERQIFSWY
jgi:hypothetical protein